MQLQPRPLAASAYSRDLGHMVSVHAAVFNSGVTVQALCAGPFGPEDFSGPLEGLLGVRKAIAESATSTSRTRPPPASPGLEMKAVSEAGNTRVSVIAADVLQQTEALRLESDDDEAYGDATSTAPTASLRFD
jgi:hypothetical protein